MQKKLLAVAVAGALGAPAMALAQATAGTSTVQIFGTIYVELDRYNNQTTAAAPGTAGTSPDRVSFDYMRTAGSEIGFKGEEQLGGGMAAWFQCASTADVRGVAPNQGFCTRNSALGLKGAWGNVYAGKWDTPYKRTYSIGNVGGGESGAFGTANLLNNGSTEPAQLPPAVPVAGAVTVGANRGIYARREVNSIFYDSPNFGGFQVLGHWQFANASTAITSGNTNTRPRSWGLAGSYSAGPLGAAIFYEKHQDQGTPAASPVGAGTAVFGSDADDSSYGLSAAYTIGPVKIGGVYKRERYDVPSSFAAGGGTGTQKVNAWHLGFDWNIVGPHGLRGGYTRAGNVKGTCMSTACGVAGGIAPLGTTAYQPGMGVRPDAGGGTSASMYQLKYVFAFSKRTEIQAGYSRINNSSAAGYNYSDIGGAVSPGRDPSAWVFTMQHKF